MAVNVLKVFFLSVGLGFIAAVRDDSIDPPAPVVLLFGGTFSPIQRSHVQTAAIAIQAVRASPLNLDVTSVHLTPVNDA